VFASCTVTAVKSRDWTCTFGKRNKMYIQNLWDEISQKMATYDQNEGKMSLLKLFLNKYIL
jgi:hypothetical protein